MQSTISIPIMILIPSILYLSFVTCLFLLIWLAYQQQQQQPIKRRSQHSKTRSIAVPNDLKIRLLAMVGGHKPTATRLLSLERKASPGRSEAWYYSKVIEDLVRDRR